MATETDQSEPVAFGMFLHTIADGDCHAELTEKLHELGQSLSKMAASSGVKTKASLALKLTFVTDGSGIVDINYDLDVKEPKPLRARSAMWLTKEGNFSGQPPRQMALELHGVSSREEATS